MTNVQPPALLELFDLARAQVRRETLGHYVMNDPGVYGLVVRDGASSGVVRPGGGALSR